MTTEEEFKFDGTSKLTNVNTSPCLSSVGGARSAGARAATRADGRGKGRKANRHGGRGTGLTTRERGLECLHRDCPNGADPPLRATRGRRSRAPHACSARRALQWRVAQCACSGVAPRNDADPAAQWIPNILKRPTPGLTDGESTRESKRQRTLPAATPGKELPRSAQRQRISAPTGLGTGRHSDPGRAGGSGAPGFVFRPPQGQRENDQPAGHRTVSFSARAAPHPRATEGRPPANFFFADWRAWSTVHVLRCVPFRPRRCAGPSAAAQKLAVIPRGLLDPEQLKAAERQEHELT